MKKAIITGSNGYIGKKLTGFLLNQGIEVVGLDLFECESFKKCPNYSFMPFTAIENIDIDSVDVLYHLAWSGVSTDDKNDPNKQFMNIGLTYKVLEFAKKNNIKKVIIPGSMSEFSKYKEPVTGHEEDTPSDLYAATKVAIRKIAYQYVNKNDLDLNWLLITSVYSEERNDANLITSCIKSLKRHEAFKCTKLEQKWDYIHINDLIKALYLIGEKGEKSEIYPIGSGEVHELSYYIELIADKIGAKDLLKIGSLPYKGRYIDNSIPDVTKIKALGFHSTETFESYIDSEVGKNV